VKKIYVTLAIITLAFAFYSWSVIDGIVYTMNHFVTEFADFWKFWVFLFTYIIGVTLVVIFLRRENKKKE
jgi:cytochrome bd-type quinol oxidase subunit 2